MNAHRKRGDDNDELCRRNGDHAREVTVVREGAAVPTSAGGRLDQASDIGLCFTIRLEFTQAGSTSGVFTSIDVRIADLGRLREVSA